MPTPPQLTRTSLPSSSPSSARLRRIAPSPVKIPPPPSCNSSPSHHATRLPHSHTALTALSSSPSTSRSTPPSTSSATPSSARAASTRTRTKRRSTLKRSGSRTDVFGSAGGRTGDEYEYEFEPLEMTRLSSPDTQIRTLFALFERERERERSTPPPSSLVKMGCSPNSSSQKQKQKTTSPSMSTRKQGKIVVPLIFDIRGEYGKLAADLRSNGSGYIEVPMTWQEYKHQQSPTAPAGDGRKHQRQCQRQRQRTTSSSSCYSKSSSGSSSSSTSSSPTNFSDFFASNESEKTEKTTGVWAGCKKRSGSNLFSPANFISKCKTRQKEKTMHKLRQNPSPIMVEFRTDIFSTKGREKIWHDQQIDESTPRPRQRTISRSVLIKRERDDGNSLVDTVHEGAIVSVEGRMVREDSGETFATFGIGSGVPPTEIADRLSYQPVAKAIDNDTRNDRKDSLLEVESLDEDGWSFTLSAYEQEQDDLSLSLSLGAGASANDKIRKDSFFASSVIAAHAEEIKRKRASASANTIRSRTISSHEPQPQSTATTTSDSLWNSEFTLGVTLPSAFATDSKFVPPHLKHIAQAIKANEGAAEPGSSPMSDTIITPQAPQPQQRSSATSSRQSRVVSLGQVDPEDTPTPTPNTVHHQHQASRLSMRPGQMHQDKGLPSLPNPSITSYDKPSSGSIVGAELDATSDALKKVDKSLTVQLWVDQEGCRENRTTLKYIRSIKSSTFREREQKALAEAAAWCESPTRPECFQQSGCWEFGMDPKERDKWLFHHAALEGLPVLRRLTINNDDKHDFLPRGATLQIKDPGVYVVCGTEDRGKVEWKFEYLVQPKVSPISGEEVPNERIIVPLAFYASPSFFAPERALRTHLLNVFKKTLTPNIVSEKIRPPHIGKPPTTIPMPLATASTTTSQRPTGEQGPAVAVPATAAAYDSLAMTSGNARSDAHTQHGLTRSETGRKRAQTQTQPLPSISSGGTPHPHPHPHTRSVSRTIGAIAKSIAGITLNSSNSTTTTPTKPYSEMDDGVPVTPGARPSSAGVSIHKFGTKAPTFGRSGSRAKTPTTASGPGAGTGMSGAVVSPSDAAAAAAAVVEGGAEKGKGRKRAASLFSRSRPFTPPVNITEMHPVPIIGMTSALATAGKSSSGNRTSMGSSTTPASASGLSQLGSAIISTSTLTLPLPLAHNSTSLSLPLPPAMPAKSHQRRSIPLPTAVQAQSQGPTHNNLNHTLGSTGSTSTPLSGTGSHPFLHPDSYMCGGAVNSPVPSAMSLSSSASSSRYSASPFPSGTRVNSLQHWAWGLYPTPRRPAMRKRPSTAEPRLGMR
ncbi:hypothetical protein IAT40_003102 [Kwoniella sp. CBS 6097]